MSARVVKDRCPVCTRSKNSFQVAYCKGEWSGGQTPAWWNNDSWSGTDEYLILRCCGCNAVYVRRDSACEEIYEVHHDSQGNGYVTHPKTNAYWPSPPRRQIPKWVRQLDWTDKTLADLLRDVYKAINEDLEVLATIGMRIVFDRASELLGVNPETTFANKLEQLVGNGHIGLSERKALDVLTNAGSAAAHRGWKPTEYQLDALATIMEQFVHRTMVTADTADELGQRIPKRRK